MTHDTNIMADPQVNAAAPMCAPPDFQPRRPKLALPPLACDTHAHILGPAARHAYSPARVYTPRDCLLPDYQHMLNTLGVARAVLVQPSVYGTDNTAMLDAMRTTADRFRGVAVVSDDISNAELGKLHDGLPTRRCANACWWKIRRGFTVSRMGSLKLSVPVSGYTGFHWLRKRLAKAGPDHPCH